MTRPAPEPLTAEALLRDFLANYEFGDDVDARIRSTLDAAPATPAPALRELFRPYFEAHSDPSEDNEWCLKHLPSVEGVRAALAASAPVAGGLDRRLPREWTGDKPEIASERRSTP